MAVWASTTSTLAVLIPARATASGERTTSAGAVAVLATGGSGTCGSAGDGVGAVATGTGRTPLRECGARSAPTAPTAIRPSAPTPHARRRSTLIAVGAVGALLAPHSLR